MKFLNWTFFIFIRLWVKIVCLMKCGEMHKARWMSKILYFIKMSLLSHEILNFQKALLSQVKIICSKLKDLSSLLFISIYCGGPMLLSRLLNHLMI